MTDQPTPPQSQADARQLDTLRRLLAIRSVELRPTLDQACTLVAETLHADKVDIFLYEAASDSLVAIGTSDTEMGNRQRRAGLDRQPLANDGPSVMVFETGTPYLNGHAHQDPNQLRGMIERLGIKSQMDVPFVVNETRRGVLHASSQHAEFLSEGDLEFFTAVSHWIAIVTHRAELIEQVTREAEDRGRQTAAEELSRLTRRQQEVATCVAEGLTNEEIAQRLTLTPGTVANHLDHMMRRLGLHSRTQIAVWAVERGLYRTRQRDDPSAT